ncbi:hypothetical protein ACHAWF_013941 [Thalassiosira exigua]
MAMTSPPLGSGQGQGRYRPFFFFMGLFVGINFRTLADVTSYKYKLDWSIAEPANRVAKADEHDVVVSAMWELNMRRARSYSISIPMNNGYSAKCIPDTTMAEMHAQIELWKLVRTKQGLSHGEPHHDDNSLAESQVGKFCAKNMKRTSDGRPIWTSEIWNHFQSELNAGKDGGPPGYPNSGKSVHSGVTWVLENILPSCGVKGMNGKTCDLSVFSAISPWAESILYWSASTKLSRNNVRITSVDFNPCIIDGMPANSVAECRSTLDLVSKPTRFDLIVSYSGIEHDGLGRYGDPINPDGDISATREMWLLTKPGGVLLLAVPIATAKYQPKSNIPIWGNNKVQVLQHRNYGAERYVRLLSGWELDGFVLAGKDAATREPNESKMEMIARMLHCSFEASEFQPLLILRKQDLIFDDVLEMGKWTADKAEQLELEYHRIVKDMKNVKC